MHRSTKAGTTLIELLAALGIGALIIAVIVLTYQTLTGSASRFSAKAREQALADSTLEFFSRELEQMFVPEGNKNYALKIENSATNLIHLEFCRWVHEKTDRPKLTNRLEQVRFVRAPVDGSDQLVQIVQATSGPAADTPSTNWPGRMWPSLIVHVFDGETWQTNWSTEKARAPGAARIILLKDQQPIREAMVIIPAGLSVTSRVQRLDGT